MNNIKSVFSIKDLENFSGIKAHTIRIWEKRYGILEPMRSDTNIRVYDLANLQKLLNITLLHDYGYKISKIAEYPNDKIITSVREIISEKSAKTHAISAMKVAMVNFDQQMFFNVYNDLLAKKSFRDIFFDVIMPLMTEIGLLWQSDTISAAHEHFISYLIKQKLLINTEKVQILEPTKTDKVFVLFLPENEVHELGLMYINYEILSSGYKTIYLGESVPLDNLIDLKKYFNKIVFISYLTIEPNKDIINNYVNSMESKVLDENSEVWFMGKMTEFIDENLLSNQIIKITSLLNFVNKLQE